MSKLTSVYNTDMSKINSIKAEDIADIELLKTMDSLNSYDNFLETQQLSTMESLELILNKELNELLV